MAKSGSLLQWRKAAASRSYGAENSWRRRHAQRKSEAWRQRRRGEIGGMGEGGDGVKMKISEEMNENQWRS
jgi:hypothetical protein